MPKQRKIKNLLKKILPIFAVVVLIWMMSGEGVYAQGWLDSVVAKIGGGVLSLPIFIMSGIAYVIMTISGLFLAACATLFNIAFQLTVHLDIFLKNNPVIYQVWETIRDLSSMLLIFFILWASFQTIIGLRQAGFNDLIKNIIIAGILINFSFFAARICIDASNIISLQFFNAMWTQQDLKYEANDSLGALITKTFQNGSGGISGIFTSAMKVNQWWGSTNFTRSAGGIDVQFAILVSNYAGALVQILAGLSFLAAGIAALWRTIVLVFLLGFSPIWIAAYAVPQLNEFKNEWFGHFKANLLFLPAYLAFMYVSVLIISKSDFNSLVGNMSNSSGISTAYYVQLFLAAAIILFMINIPLIAALKFSSLKINVVDKLSGSMASFSRWATTGLATSAATSTAGFVGRNTIGRAATAFNKMAENQKLSGSAGQLASLVGVGNSALARSVREATTNKMAQGKYLGSISLKDQKKLYGDIARKDKEIDRRQNLINALSKANVSADEVGGIMKEMSGKEKLSFDKELLGNIHVLKHFKKADFESIKGSDDIGDDVKKIVKDKRDEAFVDAIDKNEEKAVKNMMNNMDTEDLISHLNDNYKGGTNVPDIIIQNITKGKLQDIDKGDINIDVKKKIGRAISGWNLTHSGKAHVAESIINKNIDEWT